MRESHKSALPVSTQSPKTPLLVRFAASPATADRDLLMSLSTQYAQLSRLEPRSIGLLALRRQSQSSKPHHKIAHSSGHKRVYQKEDDRR